MSHDLTSALWKSEYDTEDFCQVLQTHYRRSNGSSEETAFGDPDAPSIIIRWSSKGKLKSLVAGSGFDEADVALLQDKIEAELVRTIPTYRRFVMFSLRPIEGAFAFDDWFQLVPAPVEAPRPTHGIGGHPSILEVRVDGSSNDMITARRAVNAAQEIELLLAALLKENLVSNHRPQQFHWFLNHADHDNPIYSQTYYTWSGFSGKADAFSDIAPLPDIELIDANAYYGDFGWSPGERVVLPSSLPALFLRFRALNDDTKRRFVRGAYWLQNSQLVWPISQSAAFAAMVRAIESLMSPLKQGKRCEACGGEAKPAIRAQFSEFVDSLVAGAIPKKRRLAFYDRRSRLVHGDALFSSDEDRWMGSGPRQLDEAGDHYALASLSRMVFHNWLITVADDA